MNKLPIKFCTRMLLNGISSNLGLALEEDHKNGNRFGMFVLFRIFQAWEE